MLGEVTMKIGLERIDIQKEVTIEALLDSGAIRLVKQDLLSITLEGITDLLQLLKPN